MKVVTAAETMTQSIERNTMYESRLPQRARAWGHDEGMGELGCSQRAMYAKKIRALSRVGTRIITTRAAMLTHQQQLVRTRQIPPHRTHSRFVQTKFSLLQQVHLGESTTELRHGLYTTQKHRTRHINMTHKREGILPKVE